MSPPSFTKQMNSYFRSMTDFVFAKLTADEGLTINFTAEDSLYVRFNGNRVRQNTSIEQIIVSYEYQGNGRTVEISQTVTGNFGADQARILSLLAQCRNEARDLPPDPNQVPISNNGRSSQEFQGKLASPEQIIEEIAKSAEGSDLAGLYCGGMAVSANRNSKGQDHWFATENFFLDYSLYDGSRAAKGVYAGSNWNSEEWTMNLSRTRQKLSLLVRPIQNVAPGKYRTYLAPQAASDLLAMFGWGAMSAASWKQGRSALKKLIDGEAKLSPLLTISENFSLGLTHRFNSLGEVPPENQTLIENGELKSLFVSSRSAKEYGLQSNSASGHEGPRAMDVKPGTLEEADILREIGTGLYLSNLHYLNWSDIESARITGMTRYACFWVENGEIVGPIKDLRFDESLYQALGTNLIAVTSKAEIDPEVSTYGGRPLGGRRIPGLLINDFAFTL